PVWLPAALVDAAARLGTDNFAPAERLRLLVDEGGEFERRFAAAGGPVRADDLARARADARAATGSALPLSAAEAQARYAWARETVDACVKRPPGSGDPASDRIDAVVAHRIAGPLLLLAVMALIFQALYAWSAPLMDGVEWGVGLVGGAVTRLLPPGALRSLAVDGVVAGVGGIVVFVPQIAMLFLFLAVLEDCGYMARAAFLADRLLSFCGLSGRSFLPLVSSYACAVPGVMATRTIESPRERLATILVAPLMSCSARLPVYTILIAAFIPPGRLLWGWLDRQGTTLFLFHFVGLAVAVPVAWILKKTLLRGERMPSVLELPSYHWPRPRTVLLRVWSEVREFLVRAGTLILATSIVVWGLAYFPRPATIEQEHDRLREEARHDATTAEPLDERLARIDEREAGVYLRQSLLGRTGGALEGAVAPLGWDWRIGMAALASFPAREVVIACLGTIFNVGSGHDEESPTLRGALQDARRPDGRPLFDAAVALSVMVFFALCAQCASTLAVIRRETGTWRLAAFTFFYMTALAYLGALATYQGARALGIGGA
ncbi:MAG: ferrous iron transporter B, partial [Planctomycetes bacterium]|nr:ferrous iron transporter B [Planctomycetota bacterium]